MAIKLITGIPGAGKSLCLVDEACKLRDQKNPEFPDRQIFAVGVDGLRPDVAVTIGDDDLRNWQSLPDGSIVLVDEAWKRFPPHSPMKQPDDWILALAEHRHRGFDFLVATQSPTQIAKFVRDLTEQHVHLVRKFGTHTVQRIVWESVHTDTKSVSAVKQAQVSVWRFPKNRFDLYTSSTMHTVKRRVPKRVYVAACLFLSLPVLVWLGWRSLHQLSHDDPKVSASPAVAVSVAGATLPVSVRGDRHLTASQWVNERQPRVAGVPWSAPMWDDLETTTVPDLMCIIVDNETYTTCSCYTEQVTPLPDVPDNVCRQAAEHGVYNPYRASPGRGEERPAARSAPAGRVAGRSSTAPVGDVGASAPAGLSGPPRGWGTDLSRSYTPPEWVPVPSGGSGAADYMQSSSRGS